MGDDATSALTIVDVRKTYPGTVALKGISFEIRRGEVHALVGGNGSGKSTLVKLLAGVERADAGGSFVVGSQQVPADKMTPHQARALNLRFVHQDAGVFPEISVAENLALGRSYETGLGGRVRWRAMRDSARTILDRVGLTCDPAMMLGRLSPATQTLVAIARALADIQDESDAILVLDEPTAALPNHEAQNLLATMRRLTDRGLAVLFITHRLDEVVGVADRVTVLRDGRLVSSVDGAGLTEQQLVEFIVGRPLQSVFPEPPELTTDAAALSVEHLAVGCFDDVSFTVRRGELVGIAGILGTGRSTLLRAIYGDIPVRAGRITMDGEDVTGKPTHVAIKAGMGYVPEDRKREGIFSDLSVRTNLLLASVPEFWRPYGMAGKAEASESRGLVRDFGIKTATIDTPVSSLSGGNQQKAVLARWLRRRPKLLLLDEPTQGVDVGARADIYRLIRGAVTQGTSVLMVASDFDELARVCDRVLVVRKGRVTAEVRPPHLDHTYLTELAYQG
jgi:ribose transport system ATP-binding protein